MADQRPDGLPIRTVNPDGTFSEVSYLFDNVFVEGDEYPTSVLDEGGHRRDFTYDSLGRLWMVLLVAFRKDEQWQWQKLIKLGLRAEVGLIVFSVQ